MNMEQEKAPKQEGAGGSERRGGEGPEERSVAMLAKTRGRNSDGKCLTAAGVRAHLRAASVSVCDPDLVHVFGCETKRSERYQVQWMAGSMRILQSRVQLAEKQVETFCCWCNAVL